FGLLASQPDFSERRDNQSQTHQYEDIPGYQKKARHIAGEPAAHTSKGSGSLFLQCQGQQYEQEYGACRHQEHSAMDVQTDDELAREVVLADDIVGIDEIGLPGGCG